MESDNKGSSNSSSSHSAQATQSYVYHSPQGSAFYRSVISPLCARLVVLLPRWLHPNTITILGLLSAFAGYATIEYNYWYGESSADDSNMPWSVWAVAIACQILYGLLDNVDGKQARRLGLSSPCGEFLDHAVDAIVVGWTGIASSRACVLVRGSWVWAYLPMVLLGPCLATLVTHWHHETTRQMLWGTVDYLTVDELNFVVVPLVFAVRAAGLSVFDQKISVGGGLEIVLGQVMVFLVGGSMFLSAIPLAISLMKKSADFIPALVFLVHALAVVMIAQPSTAFAPTVIAICTVIFISRKLIWASSLSSWTCQLAWISPLLVHILPLWHVDAHLLVALVGLMYVCTVGILAVVINRQALKVAKKS